MTKSNLSDFNRLWYLAIGSRQRTIQQGLKKRQAVLSSNSEYNLKKPLTKPAVYRVDPIVVESKTKLFPMDQSSSKSQLDLINEKKPVVSGIKSQVLPLNKILEFIRGAELTGDLRLMMDIHKYINSNRAAIQWTSELYAALMLGYARFYSYEAVKRLAMRMQSEGITLGFSHYKALLFASQKMNEPHTNKRNQRIAEILQNVMCDDETFRLMGVNAVKTDDTRALESNVEWPLRNNFDSRLQYFKETFKDLKINVDWSTEHTFKELMANQNELTKILDLKSMDLIQVNPKLTGKLENLDAGALLIKNPLAQDSLTPG